jgi:hypothetical protein
MRARYLALGVVVVPLIAFSVHGQADTPVPADSQGASCTPPLSSALHVFSPVTVSPGTPAALDPTLLEHLEVSVCVPNASGRCRVIKRFEGSKRRSGMRIVDDIYEVDWRPPKKPIEIHFAVADLPLGSVSYATEVREKIVIRFGIENHPIVRARVLFQQGARADDVAWALNREFGISDPACLAEILKDEFRSCIEIGEELHDFEQTAAEAAQILSDLNCPHAEICEDVLEKTYGLGVDGATELSCEVLGLSCVGKRFPPVTNALDVLPPLDKKRKRVSGLDKSLTEHLTVTVCQRDSADMCTPIVEFSSLEGQDRDRIKRRGKQYHVDWQIDKALIGLAVEIQIRVAGLTLGTVPYTPTGKKRLRIRFRVERHPVIHATVAAAGDVPVADIARQLLEDFELSAMELAWVLKAGGYETGDVHTALTQVVGMDDVFELKGVFEALCTDLPELELAYIDEFQQVSGAWKPVVPTGFHPLGHLYEPSDVAPPKGFMFAAKDLWPGALAGPVDFVKANSAYDHWIPVPPPGYVCLGFVGGASKPSTNAIMCVREDLTAAGIVGNTIDGQLYQEPGVGRTTAFVSQVVPEDGGGIYLGTFVSTVHYWYADPVFVLDATSVKRHEPDLETVHTLVQDHGPYLALSSGEPYNLDDPEIVLDGLSLVWGLVYDEWDYGSHFFEMLGVHDTSAGTLMEDVATYAEADPDAGSDEFRYFLQIDDSLKPGNLNRAKALVRVRPWNWLFTDVQFWLFYPFNGPGRVRVCASGSICNHQQLTRSGRHYGDWEHVTLRFSNIEEELVAVYMSRHAAGEWITRPDFESGMVFVGGHPVIYSGYYSHAMYPQPGLHYYERVFEYDYSIGTASGDLYDVADSSFPSSGSAVELFDPRHYEIVSSALPMRPVSQPDWLNFGGRWGQYERLSEGVYFEAPPAIPPIKVYTNEEVGAGPTGPPRKSAWQRGDSSERWWWTTNLEGNETCFDGVDNDDDEKVDCADEDCFSLDSGPNGDIVCVVCLFGPTSFCPDIPFP